MYRNRCRGHTAGPHMSCRIVSCRTVSYRVMSYRAVSCRIMSPSYFTFLARIAHCYRYDWLVEAVQHESIASDHMMLSYVTTCLNRGIIDIVCMNIMTCHVSCQTTSINYCTTHTHTTYSLPHRCHIAYIIHNISYHNMTHLSISRYIQHYARQYQCNNMIITS